MLVGTLGLAGGLGLGTSAAVGASRPRNTAPHPRVRVMTWNMHGAVPADGPEGADEERIATVIRTESPDILILNEVNQDPAGSGSFGDQPAMLEALLSPAGYRYLQYGIAERDLPRNGVVLPGSTTGNMILPTPLRRRGGTGQAAERELRTGRQGQTKPAHLEGRSPGRG